MSYKVVFLFSGQGSQRRGMGKSLFEKNDVFRKAINECDQLVKDQLHRSIIDELYFNEDPVWNDLLTTHVSIVAVEIAMYKVLESLSIVPDFISGKSLGEFAAGVASGLWNIENAITTCIEQAKSLKQENIKGGMITVLEERELIEPIYKNYNLFLASDNFKSCFTLSGLEDDISLFQKVLGENKISYFRLPVQTPFHSPLIENAKHTFLHNTIGLSDFETPKVQFLSGNESKQVERIPYDYFWSAISKYNNSIETTNYLEN